MYNRQEIYFPFWVLKTQKHIQIFSIILLMGFFGPAFGQGTFEDSPFVDMIFKIDTSVYTWQKNAIMINGKMQLPFYYDSENEVAEIELKMAGYAEAGAIQLKVSNDYIILDSLLTFDDYIRFKVKFKDLTASNFLKFVFKDQMDPSKSQFYDLGLFPHTQTRLQMISAGSELFIGEEQILNISVSNIDNVMLSNQWVSDDKANYLIRKKNDELRVHFLPTKRGLYTWNVRLPLRKPELLEETMVFESAPLIKRFEIKSGRIAFLNINKLEITPSEDSKSPNIIQIDNHERLSLEKTYRLEDQEAPGGALVAELFTQSSMSNGKVLATLRTYAYHQKSKGYLYLKENDKALFVTNFDITPRTKIEAIYIQRPGKNWEKTNQVHPGENLNIRLEGQGLHKGKFTFEGVYQQQYDSLLKNENDIQYRVEVPLDILSNTVDIYNHNNSTDLKLDVKEYQRPKELDFLILDIDGNDYPVSTLDKPIYYDKTITDLVIKFDENRIDFSNQLFGKQFLEIDVKIKNKAGNIIELYEFEDLVVCPGTFSPRGDRYDKSECTANTINLNNFIKNKTSQLPEWAQIELDIKHKDNAYETVRFNRKVIIVLKRANSYDIDVSFPAGLLVLKFDDQSDFANFGGVSLAMMAQMSFYQPGKIAEYRPYKIGAGFIFLNAFSFDENDSRVRDVGLVILGSIYPISREKKLTFPLYAGFGYFLQEKIPFFMLGPGIQVRF